MSSRYAGAFDGKLHARHFIESAWEETHCCNYLLATDLEMMTPDGYQATSWEKGYGDYVMKPIIETPLVPWLEGTAIFWCADHHTRACLALPRTVLQQVARLRDIGFEAMTATELEFFLFKKSYDEIRADGYRNLEPISGYNEDYHILQTTKEEHVMRSYPQSPFCFRYSTHTHYAPDCTHFLAPYVNSYKDFRRVLLRRHVQFGQ